MVKNDEKCNERKGKQKRISRTRSIKEKFEESEQKNKIKCRRQNLKSQQAKATQNASKNTPETHSEVQDRK